MNPPRPQCKPNAKNAFKRFEELCGQLAEVNEQLTLEGCDFELAKKRCESARYEEIERFLTLAEEQIRESATVELGWGATGLREALIRVGVRDGGISSLGIIRA